MNKHTAISGTPSHNGRDFGNLAVIGIWNKAHGLPWARIGVALAALAAGLAAWPTSGPLDQAALPAMLALLLWLLALATAWLAWRKMRQARPAPPQPGLGAPIDWARLSSLASRYFASHGLARDATGKPWGEGADIVLSKGSRSYLVHAGLWRSPQVDAAQVRRLVAEMARRRATGGMLLCAADVFTGAAQELARKSGILLLHPGQFHSLAEDSADLRPAKPGPAPRPRPAARPNRPAAASQPARAARAPSPSPRGKLAHGSGF